MCDPEIEGVAADWVIDNICPSTGSKQSVSGFALGADVGRRKEHAHGVEMWLALDVDGVFICHASSSLVKRPTPFAVC